jgi:plasmid stabilization system protein ParE
MPTAKECRYNAEICVKLADETREIYAKNALIELAEEFRELAKHLEHSSKRDRPTPHLPREEAPDRPRKVVAVARDESGAKRQIVRLGTI